MKLKLSALFSVLTLALTMTTGAHAVTVNFFDPSQVMTLVSSGTTSDTISSNGYLFTYTRDKLFTGGVGLTTPIGRDERISWPQGVEAQAITVAPYGKAQITLSRVDGNIFDITAFSARLLANTAATGAAFEVMPLVNGEDAYNDPVFFDASGYYWSTFAYDSGTPAMTLLSGYDTYKFTLFVDFAVTGLTLVDASVAPQPVPAPGAVWLLGSGMLGLVGVGRRRSI